MEANFSECNLPYSAEGFMHEYFLILKNNDMQHVYYFPHFVDKETEGEILVNIHNTMLKIWASI